MTSFAELLCVAAVLSGPARAQEIDAAYSGPTLEAASRLAASWRVAPERVRIEWGAAASGPLEGMELRKLFGRGRDGWYVAVLQDAAGRPLSLRLRAGLEDTVMIAARSLEGGARVSPGDLRAELRVCWGVPGRHPPVRPGPGWEVKRPLSPGDVAAYPALAPPLAVLAGDEVRLEWRHEVVSVSARGIALNAARAGEAVRVRVPGRPEPLTGRVTARGRAVLQEEGSR